MVVNSIRSMEIPRGKSIRLASDWVPYDLRHTYCTDLQRAGIDIRTAQKLMGHANISITADIYTHVDEEQILDAAKILGAKKSGESELKSN